MWDDEVPTMAGLCAAEPFTDEPTDYARGTALLNRLAGLILLATLLFSGFVVLRQTVEDWLPIRHVDVVGHVGGQLHPDTRAGLSAVLARAQGGLASIDLESTQRDFEAMPWVRRAALSRIWPDRLRVELEEHVPAAAWNGTAVLDAHGEVFPIRPWPGLPRFVAPEGTQKEVARRYVEFTETLASHGWRIESLRLDARFAWQLNLAGGPVVDLGRERLDERLRRFIAFYPRAVSQFTDIRRVDMRYPNGFAVQGGTVASTAVTDSGPRT